MLRPWAERWKRRHAVYIARVNRIGAARYSLRWAAVWAVMFFAFAAYDLLTDDCCGRSVLEIAVFAGVFGMAMGALFFLLGYLNVRVDLWLSRRREP
jgi:hypothetical protein